MGPMRTQEYILTVWSAGKRKCQDAEGNCLLLISSESGTSFLDQSQIRKRNTNAIFLSTVKWKLPFARNGLLKHGSLHNVSFVGRKALRWWEIAESLWFFGLLSIAFSFVIFVQNCLKFVKPVKQPGGDCNSFQVLLDERKAGSL